MRGYGTKRVICYCDTPMEPCGCNPKRARRKRARREGRKETEP